MSSAGTILFHCDRNATHLVRFIMDQVSGKENFRSEIIWYYRRWSNFQKALLPAHQTIYFYSKSAAYTFNTIYSEYSPSTNVDQILQKRRRDEHGKTIYDRDEQGNVISNGVKKGVPLSDVWDIPYLNPKAKERVGYPTQKPVLLLERIIELGTDPGDLVLDPFCGSGTTLVAAQLLGRRCIGIDSSEEAVKITQERLVNPIKTRSSLLEKGRETYRTADVGLLGMLQGFDFVAVHRNKGIDAIASKQAGDEVVPIRIQRNGESLLQAALALAKAGKKKNAKLMILVGTDRHAFFEVEYELPAGVAVVEATAIGIEVLISEAVPDTEAANTVRDTTYRKAPNRKPQKRQIKLGLEV